MQEQRASEKGIQANSKLRREDQKRNREWEGCRVRQQLKKFKDTKERVSGTAK